MIDQDAVWFITGCSAGLGKALSEAVLEKGYRAVVTARDPARVSELAENYPDRALAVALDVNRPEQVRSTVDLARQRFGSVDALVNNAGNGYLASIEEAEDDEVRALFETNFFGAVATMQAVIPAMRERAKGHIVNVTSIGGLPSFAGTGFYHATKYALEGLSESTARKWHPSASG